MYIVLNLRDQSSISHVINLLFTSGYTSVSVGDRLEDLCPTCDLSQAAGRPSFGSRARVARNRMHSTPRVTVQSSTPSGNTNRSSSTNRNSQFFQKAKQEIITDDHEHQHDESATAAVSVLGEDEELIDVGGEGEDADVSTVSTATALRLLSTSGGEEVYEEVVEQQVGDKDDHLPATGGPSPSRAPLHGHQLRDSSARKRKIPNVVIMAGDDGTNDVYQCQICKKKILRTGQPANLVNHLNRHARLHASKKQFSCGNCGAFFTRRYLTANHIAERHRNSPNTPIIDYGNDLRAEYSTLLERCFPHVHRMREMAARYRERERERGESPDDERVHHDGLDDDLQEDDDEYSRH